MQESTPSTASDPPLVPATADPTDDHWRSGRLDLDAYLRRIGVSRPGPADGTTLATLHRAHLGAIPFENLDVVLGRGISVDLDDVQAKLVDRARGGYCYEHATLFAAALERVGFQVDRVLARTGDPAEHPRPRSHLVLLVTGADDDERWLADVGFGSGLLRPLRLREEGPQQQGDWAYQLVRGSTPGTPPGGYGSTTARVGRRSRRSPRSPATRSTSRSPTRTRPPALGHRSPNGPSSSSRTRRSSAACSAVSTRSKDPGRRPSSTFSRMPRSRVSCTTPCQVRCRTPRWPQSSPPCPRKVNETRG